MILINSRLINNTKVYFQYKLLKNLNMYSPFHFRKIFIVFINHFHVSVKNTLSTSRNQIASYYETFNEIYIGKVIKYKK